MQIESKRKEGEEIDKMKGSMMDLYGDTIRIRTDGDSRCLAPLASEPKVFSFRFFASFPLARTRVSRMHPGLTDAILCSSLFTIDLTLGSYRNCVASP